MRFAPYLLQHELDKELLELLVAVVDAELFEAVVVKYLESVNVEHANQRALSVPASFEKCGQAVVMLVKEPCACYWRNNILF